MRIPAALKHRVKDAYADQDGYWIILARSWKCPTGYWSEKTIHEDSYKEAVRVLKQTRFVLE